MGKDFSLMEDSNRSGNPSIHDVSAHRRLVLQGGLGAALTGLLAPLAGCATAPASSALPRGALGFTSVPVSTADSIAVPPGYIADVIINELKDVATDDEKWGAKFKVLKENIAHHIKEEERMMFPAARGALAREELLALGARRRALKAELER